MIDFARCRTLPALAAVGFLAACAGGSPLRGTGDLGLVVERAAGQVAVVDTTHRTRIATIGGLGDLSHASVVYARDGRYAFVFGRDGALSKVDLLEARLVARVQQAGNSIGGAISQDGSLVAVANYEPGGVKVFSAEDLAPVADIPSVAADGGRSKVVGLEETTGRRFAVSLFEAGEIWLIDLTDAASPNVTRFPKAGRQPYDALVSPDGRYYLAGLFGEDGVAMLDLWHPERGLRRVLDRYGRGEEKLPVYKMPHLEGWAVAGGRAFLPAIGRHEVLVVDMASWTEVGRVKVAGQPVFVMARPDGRQLWVNFALPDNHKVEVIDTETLAVSHRIEPGKGVLHMEFAPKGETVWLSVRDEDRVEVWDTETVRRVATLPADKPSGIFFTARAGRLGL